jgi:hypothetical protein
MNRRPHRRSAAHRPPRRSPAHAPPALFTRIVIAAAGESWLDELPSGAELWPPSSDPAASAPADRFPTADEFSTDEARP